MGAKLSTLQEAGGFTSFLKYIKDTIFILYHLIFHYFPNSQYIINAIMFRSNLLN